MKGCVFLRGLNKCRREVHFVGCWDTVPQGQRFRKQKLANHQLVLRNACVCVCVDFNRILLKPKWKENGSQLHYELPVALQKCIDIFHV